MYAMSMSANIGKVVTQYSFNSLLSQAWMQAISIKYIIAGFSVTGVFPLNRSKLLGLTEDIATPCRPFNPMLHSRPPSEHQLTQNFSNEQMQHFYGGDVESDSDDFVQWKKMYCKYKGVRVSNDVSRPFN